VDRTDGPDRGWAPTWAVASGGLTVFAFIIQNLVRSGHVDDIAAHTQTAIVPILSIAAAVSGLWPAAPRAWRAFRRRKPDGYLATTIGVLILVGLGQWLAAAACSSIVAVWIAVRRA